MPGREIYRSTGEVEGVLQLVIKVLSLVLLDSLLITQQQYHPGRPLPFAKLGIFGVMLSSSLRLNLRLILVLCFQCMKRTGNWRRISLQEG